MENRTQKWWSGALVSLMILAAGCSAKPVIEELPSTQAQETDMHIAILRRDVCI